MRVRSFVKLSFLILGVVLICGSARAQTSAFTYQGKLNDNGAPANGQYDFMFRLFLVAAGGAQLGADVVRDNVQVANGTFTVNLDFGTLPFTSVTGNFLEISVRPGASNGDFTTLAPRLAVNSSPYSIKSLDATNLGGVAANQYLTTAAANTSFIQNTTNQQTSSSFNISGNGRIGGSLFANTGEIGPSGANFGYQFFVNGQGAAMRVENSTNEGTLASFGSKGWFVIDGGGFSAMRMSLGPNGDVGFGTHAPQYKMEIIDVSNRGLRVQTNGSGGTVASFGGNGNFQIDAPSFPGGRFIVLENGSVGIGTTSPAARFHVTGTGIVRARLNSNDNAGLALTLNDQPGWSIATVTGGQFQIFNDATGQNAFWINAASNNVGIGTTAPQDRLDVNGIIRFSGLGSAGSATLCRNASNQISNCSSSLRYKSNVKNFDAGLDLIGRLRPISFNWKEGGSADFGLVAEEVARIEPLLVTKNERGEIEGVKYDRVGVVLINAVREQQQQIQQQQKQINEQTDLIKSQSERLERQQTEIERQKSELEALKKLVCAANEASQICQPKDRF